MRELAASILVLILSAVTLSEARAQDELGFRVVVHAENPTPSLSRKQVARMFLKGVHRWEGGERVKPVDQLAGPVRASFTYAVHGRSMNAIRSFWQRQVFSGKGTPPPALDGDRAVLKHVAVNPGGIGYVSLEAVLDPEVRVLEVTGKMPVYEHDRYPAREAEQPPEPEPIAPVVLMDPRMPGLLYLSSPERGLLRSVDGGESWSRVRQGALSREITDLVVDPSDPEIVYAGSRKGLYRSTDGGRRFGFVDDVPRDVIRVEIDPRDSSTLYVLARPLGRKERLAHVADRGSLWRSRDRGESFVELRSPASAFAFDSAGVGLYVVANRNLYWSDDGQTWHRHGTIGYEVHDLAVDPSSPRQLYGATQSGVVRSFDSGARWQNVGPSQRIHRVVVAPPVLLALGERAIWRSLDEGETWQKVAEVEARTIARDPRNPDRFVVGCAGRFGHSSDRGASWTFDDLPSLATDGLSLRGDAAPRTRGASPLHLSLNRGPDDHHVAAIAVDPKNLQGVYAASQHGVWKSLDAGDTWSFAGGGLEITDVHALAVDRVDAWVLYAGTHGAGVWKSTDGGGSWWPARRGLTDLVIHSLGIDPQNSRVLYAGTRAGLFTSRDAGASWQVLEEFGPAGRVGRSEGEPWMAPARALAFEPRHGLPVIVGTERGSLYEGNFMALSAERLDGPIGFHSSRALTGCQVTWPPGVRRAPSSSRCFEYFGIDPEALAIRDLVFPSGHADVAYAATLFGIWRRSAGGRSWTRVGLDTNAAAIVVDPRNPDNLYAGTTEGLRLSTDGGAKWRQMRVEEPVYSLAIDTTGLSVYAGLEGGQVAVLRDVGLDDGSLLELRRHLPSRSGYIWTSPDFEDSLRRPEAEDVEEAWRRLEAAPVTRYRQRARLAAELLDGPLAAELLDGPLATERLDGPLADRRIERARRIKAACQDELETLDGSIRSVDVSPDGRWLTTFHLVDDGEQIYSELRLHDLDALRPTPDGLRPGLMHWHALHDVAAEPEHLRPVWILPDPGPLLAWSTGGGYLATHAADDRIRVWSVAAPPMPSGASFDPRQPRIPSSHVVELALPAGVGVGALRDDGQAMAITGHDDFLAWVVRDRGSLSVTPLIDRGAGSRVTSADPASRRRLVLTRDGRRLLSFDRWGRAGSWLLESGAGAQPPAFEVLYEAGAAFAEVKVSDDGRWLAGNADGQALLWRLTPDGLEASPEILADGGRFAFLFSGDQRWLAVHGEGELRLWDVSGAELGLDVLGVEHEGELPSFSPDGRYFLIRDLETARIWDLSMPRFPMHVEGIRRPAGWQELALPLEKWWDWPARVRGPGASSRDRRWFARAQGIDVSVWDLAAPTPRAMLGRAGRFGPVNLFVAEAPVD